MGLAVAAPAAAAAIKLISSSLTMFKRRRNVVVRILAGSFLITFGIVAYSQQKPQADAGFKPEQQFTSTGEPGSAQSLGKDQVRLDVYVVEINSNDDLFGAQHWPSALDHNSATFALNGSVGTDAIFPKHAFFKEGLILAEPVAKAKLRALIQRGKLKASNPPVAYSEPGQRVQIHSLQQHRTIFLEETAATPYTFNTGLTLDIVPRISEDGIIDLAINSAFSTQIGSQSDVPTISTGSATAQVKLRSGDAAVIGGLTREAPIYTNNNVPGLRNIPLMDYLFQSRATASERTNVVIIVWARIADKTLQHGPGDVAALYHP
jgi:type II secretory pathway component GspD/PulD (secretin)